MTRRLGAIAFLLVVPLGVFLLLGELTLRVYLTRHMFYDVEMSRYSQLLKIDSPNPLIGHHHRPNGAATLMGVSVRTNADGFRDDDHPRERGASRRIVFLGDSLTFGWGVEKEHTFEDRLERALDEIRPTEIINLGVGNYNTTQEAHLFFEKGLAYAPDAVVLFYFINDAEPVPKRSKYAWLGNFRMATFFWSRVKALSARWSPQAGFESYYADLYREDQEGWAATREAFRMLARRCREHDIDFRVVLLPELHQLDPYTFAREYALVSDFLRANEIPVLDLAPFFAGEPEPQSLWVSFDDAHPNAEAHRRIANYTFDFLLEAGDS